MKGKSSSAIRWAVGYAILWGGGTMVVPVFHYAEYHSLGVALNTSLLGAIIIALGFGVYRRSELAAWALVMVAVFDIVVRILMHHSGLLMPLILLALALQAGIYLRRHPQAVAAATEPVLPKADSSFTTDALQSEPEQSMSSTPDVSRYRASWPELLAAGGAFLQAGFTILVLLVTAEESRLRTGIEGVNIYSLLDVVILSAFGIAVLKRHLWAAYALVGYGLISYSVEVVQRREPWAAYFVIYLVGAWFLRKKPHVAPETIRMLQWRSIIKYAIVCWVGFEIIDTIVWFTGFEAGVAHVLLLVVWGAALFGFQAWRAPGWSFETALITSIVAFSLSILDALIVPIRPAALLLRLVGAVAIAMLGVGCASMLPRPTALVSDAETP